MNVGTNGNIPEQRNDMECKCISHRVWINNMRSPRSGAARGKSVPIYRSGIRKDMASQARYIDPMLWPKRVNRGQDESSTNLREARKTK